ncbi:MAG: hypothetical protein ACIAQF_03655 [Phycisphaerales bacterium JB065]
MPTRFFVVFIAVFTMLSLVGVMFVGDSPSGWASPLTIRKPNASFLWVFLITNDDGESFEYLVVTEERFDELILADNRPDEQEGYYGGVAIQKMSTARVIAPFVLRREHRLSVRSDFVRDHYPDDAALSEALRIASREARIHFDVPHFADDRLQIGFGQSQNDSITLPGRRRLVVAPPSLLLLYGTVPFAIAWLITMATQRPKPNPA